MSFLKLIRAGLRTLLILSNNIYCIPTYAIWCTLLLPVRLLIPDLYWWIEGQFFEWLLTFVAHWSYSAGYHVVETGDRIDGLINEETLLLANHQSTADVPLLMQTLSARRGLTEKLNWVIDAKFMFTPFGVVSGFHGDFFIKEGKDNRKASLDELDAYLEEVFVARKRKWLVLFPEGGFLCNRREASKRYALKKHLPSLDYVTIPRLGAFKSILDVLGPTADDDAASISSDGSGDRRDPPKLKYIIDMTIAYPDAEKPLDLGNIVTGNVPPCQVRMHYKVYPIDEIPCYDPDHLEKWLNKIYIAKNNLLGHFYRTGVWNPSLSELDIPYSSSTLGFDIESRYPLIQTQPFDDSDESSMSSPIMSSLIQLIKSPPGGSVADDFSNSTFDDDACVYEPLSENERIQLADGERAISLDMFRIYMIHALSLASSVLHITAFRMIVESWS